MRLLIELAVFSTIALLAVAFWLWKSLHGRSITLSIRRIGTTPVARRRHPRPDLAVGMVTPMQTVRRRTLSLEADPGENMHVPRGVERPDRAYARKDFGDLSDPDLRKAAAVGTRQPGYVPESY